MKNKEGVVFCQSLKKIREELDLSQKEFSALLEIPRSSYSEFERFSRLPDVHDVEKISKGLNMSIQSILKYGKDQDASQEAKRDAGKPKLSLVPRQIIRDIAVVREYGNKKYGDPENWKTIEKERYIDAFFRHWLAYLDDPKGVDEESGIPHLKHAACNLAFLCEMEGENWER